MTFTSDIFENIRSVLFHDIFAPPKILELLKSFIEGAIELLQADAGEIFLWNEENQELRLSISYGFLEKYTGVILKPGEEISGKVFEDGQPIVIDNYDEWEGKSSVFQAHPPHISVIAVPMISHYRRIGVMVIDINAEKRIFNSNDARLAGLFANVAGMALESERLYQDLVDRSETLKTTLESEVSLRTKELAFRALQLETSAEVSKVITSILDKEKLIPRVTELIHASFGYYHVQIFILDITTNQLVLMAGNGNNSLNSKRRDTSLNIGSGSLNGLVASKNVPMLINDVTKNPDFLPDCFLPDTKSELVVPLRLGSKVLGTLDVHSDEFDAFSEGDVMMLQSLADQVAVAIENTRLYEQSREYAIIEERNRLARDLHDAVTQTLFSASLISDVLPKIWKEDPVYGQQLLEEQRQLTRGALSEMRTLLLELRPEALIEANLGQLIHQISEAITGRTGIIVEVVLAGPLDLPSDVKIALYRILQEALNNITKHSNAKKAIVEYHCEIISEKSNDHRRKQVLLSICDDGIGFDLMEVSSDHLGLKMLKERAKAIDADVKIIASQGSGTKIEVVWKA